MSQTELEATHDQRLKIMAAHLRNQGMSESRVSQELYRYHVNIFVVSDGAYKAEFNLSHGLPEDAPMAASSEVVETIAKNRMPELEIMVAKFVAGEMSRNEILAYTKDYEGKTNP